MKNKIVTKCNVYFALVLTILALCASAAVIALISTFEHSGFFDVVSPVIVSSSCSDSYLSNKFTNIIYHLKINFILSIIVTFLLLLVFITILFWVIKTCKANESRKQV